MSGSSHARLAATLACFLIAIGLVKHAHAAKVEKPGVTIHLIASSERGLAIRKPDKANVIVSNFKRDEARKFLLLALGPEVFDKAYGSGSSFFGAIPDERCVVENTLLGSNQTFTAKKDAFAAQARALQTCVVTRVINASGMPLRIPPNQRGCKVEAQPSPNEAILSGGYCFVGVGIESLFYLNYEIKPECRSQAFLDLNGLDSRDFFAFAGFFVSGDASGQSLDLTPLDSVSIRFTQEPPSGVVPLSVDMGTSEARFPTRIEPAIEMGGVKILDLGTQGTSLEGSLHVSNTCAARCARGRCVNPCDFPVALGALVTLVDRTLGVPVHVVYAGGVAPPQWEGLMPFQTRVPPQLLVPGHKYSIEIDLAYPDQYFNVFKQGFRQYLVDVADVADALVSAGFGTLPTLKPLPGAGGLPDIPIMPPLGGLLDNRVDVGDALSTLNRLVKFNGWPPFYESLCQGDRCVDIRANKNTYKVGAEFEIVDFIEGEAALRGVTLWRKSALRGDARKSFPSTASLRCELAPTPF